MQTIELKQSSSRHKASTESDPTVMERPRSRKDFLQWKEDTWEETTMDTTLSTKRPNASQRRSAARKTQLLPVLLLNILSEVLVGCLMKKWKWCRSICRKFWGGSIVKLGLGDGSFSKGLVTQAWGDWFSLQHPHKSGALWLLSEPQFWRQVVKGRWISGDTLAS